MGEPEGAGGRAPFLPGFRGKKKDREQKGADPNNSDRALEKCPRIENETGIPFDLCEARTERNREYTEPKREGNKRKGRIGRQRHRAILPIFSGEGHKKLQGESVRQRGH